MVLLPMVLLAIQLPTGQVADPAAFSRPLVQLMETEWPKNRTVTVVCHGHSVPAGYFQTPTVQTFDAYPHLLHEALKKRYPNAVINVIVTAIGGEESESGAERFERDVMSLKPDMVTIDYGLNDRRLGLERARAAWEAMIEQAQKGGARVILLTPSWDLGAHPEDPGDPLSQHALQIRGLAKKYGTGLADSLDAFRRAKASGVDPASQQSQSNHPNRAGHELILRGLLPWFGIDSPLREPFPAAPQGTDPRLERSAWTSQAKAIPRAPERSGRVRHTNRWRSSANGTLTDHRTVARSRGLQPD